jgi:hypothetical protein
MAARRMTAPMPPPVGADRCASATECLLLHCVHCCCHAVLACCPPATTDHIVKRRVVPGGINNNTNSSRRHQSVYSLGSRPPRTVTLRVTSRPTRGIMLYASVRLTSAPRSPAPRSTNGYFGRSDRIDTLASSRDCMILSQTTTCLQHYGELVCDERVGASMRA